LLKKTDPDIITLQEVWTKRYLRYIVKNLSEYNVITNEGVKTGKEKYFMRSHRSGLVTLIKTKPEWDSFKAAEREEGVNIVEKFAARGILTVKTKWGDNPLIIKNVHLFDAGVADVIALWEQRKEKAEEKYRLVKKEKGKYTAKEYDRKRMYWWIKIDLAKENLKKLKEKPDKKLKIYKKQIKILEKQIEMLKEDILSHKTTRKIKEIDKTTRKRKEIEVSCLESMIVSGDLNIVKEQFKDVFKSDKGLKDLFSEIEFGATVTEENKYRRVRANKYRTQGFKVDYIMYSSKFIADLNSKASVVVKSGVLPLIGAISDHHPLMVEFIFKQKEE
jgi:exonuclease III